MTEQQSETCRVYLAVPYAERRLAREHGARWDPKRRAWYAHPNANTTALRRWWPSRSAPSTDTSRDPAADFAAVLREMGGVTSVREPLRLDGHPRRLPAIGDRRGARAIFYVAHLDGAVPRGYIKNHRTGEERRWVAKGYTLSAHQRAELNAAAAQQDMQRRREQQATYERVAERVQAQLRSLSPVIAPTPYLQAKGVSPHRGLFCDKRGRTYVPASDAQGALWSVQTIHEDGTKRFAKGGRKSGCMHVVGGQECLVGAPVLVIAEGYATAATLAELLDQPTIAAFDSGNLKPVAEALRRRFPDRAILIAGDDDVALEHNPHVQRNVGRDNAQNAAQAVGGRWVVPVFAPGEQQADPKRFTDFNDLAVHSLLGRGGAARQIRAAYDEVLGRARSHRTRLPQRTASRRSTRRGRHA